ncbi:MAG: zinc-binding dehydrogenase [Euryarchaeota archaeon]|nr:zinc-binding dehydrogenase [Euryarchaeota archaeon]
MKAVVLRRHGGPEVLQTEEVPTPEPGPKEVRVRVAACALNHLDVWVRRGLPNLKLTYPHILGSDIAGTVDTLGPGAHAPPPGSPVLLSPGVSCRACARCIEGRDDLCPRYGILGENRNGGYADCVVVPQENLLPMPPRLKPEEAACIPLVFLTAWHMLLPRAQIRPGETVLVMAAGSGVGSAALQIARLHGCTVIAAAGSDDKLQKARALGADHTINYTREDLVERIRALTGGHGVEVVADHTGTQFWDRSLRCLAHAGRLVTVGATSGFDARVDLRHLFFRRLSLLGSTMGSTGDLWEVLRFVEQGRLRPVLDSTFPLEEAPQAHRRIEKREVFGKVVLRVPS